MWKDALQLLLLLTLAPTGIAEGQCSSGFPSPDQLTAMLTGNVVHRNEFSGRLWLFPDMTFSCEGAVSKWIVGAEWVGGGTDYHDMQIWRLISGDTYEIVGSVELRIAEESPNKVYEYTVDPPMPFLTGDIVGVLEPRRQLSHIQLYFEEGQGPTNYYHFTDVVINPYTLSHFHNEVASPLIAVEIVYPGVSTPQASSSPVTTGQAGPEGTPTGQEVEPTSSETTSQVAVSPTPTSTVKYSLPDSTAISVSKLRQTVAVESVSIDNTPVPEPTDESNSSSGSSDRLTASVVTTIPVQQPTDESSSSSGSSDQLSAIVDTPTPVPKPTDESSSSSGSSDQLSAIVDTPTPVPKPTDESSSSSGSSDQLSAIVDTPTPVPKPTDESSSSSGSSDWLLFSGIAVGVIAVILEVVFIAMVFRKVVRKFRKTRYALPPKGQELQENQAYAALNTDTIRRVLNLTYGEVEGINHEDHKVATTYQSDPDVYERIIHNPLYDGMVDNPQYNEVADSPQYDGVDVNPQYDGMVVNPQYDGLVINPCAQYDGMVNNPQYGGGGSLVDNPQYDGMVDNPQYDGTPQNDVIGGEQSATPICKGSENEYCFFHMDADEPLPPPDHD